VGLFGMEAWARVGAFLAVWRVCVPFWLVGACVCLFGWWARVCAFWACGSSWWAFLARREGRVCVPFWLVGTAGGPSLLPREGRVFVPFWFADACVCLFGLWEQPVGLFGIEGKGACVSLVGWVARVCSGWVARVCEWLVGACVCLFDLLE